MLRTQNKKFKELKTLTKWTRIFCLIGIVGSIIGIWCGFYKYFDLVKFNNDQWYFANYVPLSSYAFVTLALLIPLICLFLQVLAKLVTFLFIVWVYRVYYNTALLTPMSHDPIYSVLSFFVPIFNIVAPYVVLKELWIENYSAVDARSTRVNDGQLVAWFWVSWIISSIFFGYVIMNTLINDEENNVITFTKFIMGNISELVDLLFYILALRLIYRLYTMHMEKREYLLVQNSPLPV